MNVIKLIKTGTSTVVAIGVGRLVNQLIENNTDEPEGTTNKVVHKVSAYALGAMVADRTAQYTDRFIDECVEVFDENVKPMFQKKDK